MINITIIGSGALAKFVGAQLINTHQVNFLGNYIHAYFKLIENKKSYTYRNYHLNTTIQPIDILLILTSSAYNTTIVDKYRSFFANFNGIVLNFQNGMGYEDLFKQAFPLATCYFGFTTQAVLKIDDFTIKNAGDGKFFLPDAAKQHPEIAQISSSLAMEFTQYMEHDRLKKLSVNCVINPVTCMFNIPNGLIFSHPEAKILAHKIIQEIAPWLIHQGIYEDEKHFFTTVKDLSNKTAKNYSSMLSAKIHQQVLETKYIIDYLLKHVEAPSLKKCSLQLS